MYSKLLNYDRNQNILSSITVNTKPSGTKTFYRQWWPSLYPMIWVGSWKCGCLVTWFCYQLIAKSGNKPHLHDPTHLHKGLTQEGLYSLTNILQYIQINMSMDCALCGTSFVNFIEILQGFFTGNGAIMPLQYQCIYGSGHEGAPILLPGFAIKWQQNQVTRQAHLHDLTPIIKNISKWFAWIHKKWWYNHNKTKHDKTMSISNWIYRKISNIRRTKSPNLNVSRLVVQLSLPNPLKPDVKLRMKM